MGGLIFAVVLGAIGLGAGRMMLESQALIRRAWSDAAEELGLQFDPGGMFTKPEIVGLIDGISVVVDVYSTDNSYESNATRYRVDHATFGPPVILKRQAGFSRMARLFGKRDVEVGDPFFDSQVVVDTVHDEQIRAFLTPLRRAVVLEVFDRWDWGEITQSSIVVRRAIVERSAAIIVETVLRLVDIAKVMGDPERVEQALEKQEQGNIADAVHDLHILNQELPNSFTQALEAEGLIELGDHEQAAGVFDQLNETLPTSTDPAGWQVLANAPSPVLLPAPPQPVGVALDQQSVIDDLFDAGRVSHNIVEQFERHYVGQRVAWRGLVTNTHSYRHDNDFGEGPGVKATVLLGGSGRSSLISNEVHAMVQMPADVGVQRGSELSFTGTLIRVDRFARKLYIQDGEPAD